ncbi:MAG: M23 family metallopeptidase [Clostridia bacterium]
MLKFLKKNGYYVMLGVCVICIATVIAVAVTSNNRITELNKPKPTPTPPAITTPKPSPTPKPVDTLPTAFTIPVKDAVVGLDYSIEKLVFSETLNQWQTHTGLDFKTKEPTAVSVICDGKVEKVITDDILNGGTVVVSHSGGLKTVYMSLGSEIPVKAGDVLKAGDTIGMTSMSAYSEFKEGAHLHLEMTLNDVLVNPNDYISVQK